MLDLTGQPVLVLTALLASGVTAAAVLLRGRSAPGRRLQEVGARAALVLVAQFLAVASVFLGVNDQYGFYSSWSDLFGQTTQTAAIVTAGRTAAPSGSLPAVASGTHGVGTTETITTHAGAGGPALKTLVWLPPQYGQARYAHTAFPVVMFLPGQPSNPARVFQQYAFGATASAAIAAGQVAPFVAAFPPLMTNPPRDTECTNVPGGPQALDWLTKDVPSLLRAHVRVARPGPLWSVMGWSTGGFCASKLLLTHPREFHAAVSFGGYFTPLTDSTTGDLFGGSPTVRNLNSPLWLYDTYGLRGTRLLVVAGKQDPEAWRAGVPLLRATRSDPGVSHIVFPLGGHNYTNYRAYLAPALHWLGP